MAIVVVIGEHDQVEELTKISYHLYIANLKAKHPEVKTEIEEGHVDRKTGEVSDREWILSTDGKRHTDRLDDPIEHADSAIDKSYVQYDDEDEGDDLNVAHYYNLNARTVNGANIALTNYTIAEAKQQGFFQEGE